MGKPDVVPEGAELVALVPVRLMAPTRKRKLPPDVSGSDYEMVAQQAIEWQEVSTHAVFWEMGAASRGAEQDRVYGLAGQMAAVGEQLALAYSAAVEVSLWKWVMARKQPADPAQETSMRAMAEAQCYFLMGAGHGLANVAVYALALDAKLRAALTGQFGARRAQPSFLPFSDRKEDWVSMNAWTSSRIERVAAESSSEVVALIHPVAAFGQGNAWRDLTARRGEDFHQWRPQSHGLAGVSKKSPWKKEGKTKTLSFGRSGYGDASDLAETSALTANAAMLELARAMRDFLEKWPLASEALGGPKFRTKPRGETGSS